MSILQTIHSHYGSVKKDMSFSVDIVRVVVHAEAPRPYTTYTFNIEGYNDLPSDIHTTLTDQIFHDTGTSKRVTDLIGVLLAYPDGISRRTLHSRYRMDGPTLGYLIPQIPEQYLLNERKHYLTPSPKTGRRRYETRLFLTLKGADNV